jgi:hypothetical protein
VTEREFKRTPLPPLVHRGPECPVCDKEVDGDGDSYWCEGCGGTWGDSYDEPGEAQVFVPQCGAEVEPFRESGYENIARHRYRCVRDAGHPLKGWSEQHVGVRTDRDDLTDTYNWSQGQFPQVKKGSRPRPAKPAMVMPPLFVTLETVGGVL